MGQEDDGLDEIEVSESARRPRGAGGAPSVVIAPHAEVPVQRPSRSVQAAVGPRQKRGQEPTLVIRDRQKVREIRAQLDRLERRGKSRHSVVFWVGAGLGAFALGAIAVSLLGGGPSFASVLRGRASEHSIAPGALTSSREVVPPPQKSVNEGSLEEGTVNGAAAIVEAPQPTLAAAPLPSPVRAEAPAPAGVPEVVTPREPSGFRPQTDGALSLDEPADSTKATVKKSPFKAPAETPRAGNVVSLDDLPTE